MGKIELFRVDFTRNKRTFYPGEILQGSIVLKTKKELKLRGIRVLFRGESRVRWTESHTSGSGSTRRTSHRTYSNHEDHINVMATIYGKGRNYDSCMQVPVCMLIFNCNSWFLETVRALKCLSFRGNPCCIKTLCDLLFLFASQ